MTTILAIDPGTKQTAWILSQDGMPYTFGIDPNEDVLEACRSWLTLGVNAVVIEQVQSYGMAVGQEVFRTVHWAGRFEEACHPIRVGHLTRPVIKAHLCHTAKAKDANVRQVLIDRFGGSEATRKGGVLYGIHRDVWAALAILVTYQDWQEGAPVRMSA